MERGVFAACANLISVTIPKSMKSMCSFAFSGSENIVSLYIEAEVPPQIVPDEDFPFLFFSFTKEPSNFYVPASSVNRYKTDFFWDNYADRIFAKP